MLQFSIGQMQWWTIQFDNNATYDGSLRYMSSCASLDKKLYLTGGCFVSNSQPSSACFELNAKTATKPLKKKNMLLKRYAHSSVFFNGCVFALGGFSHTDLPNEVPVTLASCERFSVIDNAWTYVSTMNEARAFTAAVTFESQFIYVFGGLHDF